MTNKVKPFYIRITDDMTPQMVQDAFDKCVDAGVHAEECIGDTKRKHKYQDGYHTDLNHFNYFGVDEDNITVLYDNNENYGVDTKEITLDQIDEWLGLELELEWKSGDECIYKGDKAVVIGAHPNENTIIIDSYISGLEACDATELSKPETPEQKAEREKREAIDDIKSTIDFFSDSYMSALSLYEQGYRKK